MGWWFYQVAEDGSYENTDMGQDLSSPFTSAPWYVGVFQNEAGEPFPGWLWYRHFLDRRKKNQDCRKSFSYWNAGWGQWGIDIDDPSAAPYIRLASELGIEGIAFGSGLRGKGLRAYAQLAQDKDKEPPAFARFGRGEGRSIRTGFALRLRSTMPACSP